MSFTTTCVNDQGPFCTPSNTTAPTITLNAAIDTLNSALINVATAVAALRRAGPVYTGLSEHLWTFAAGSWNRNTYELKVGESTRWLPKVKNVHADVLFAWGKVKDGIVILRKHGDVRDAKALQEVLEMDLKDGW